MTRGGARVRSGPAANPNSLRQQRNQGDWISLPASGRSAPAPAWPLTRPSTRERTLWARLWSRPQAIMWEQLGLDMEVAMHVRTLVRAEDPGAPMDARKVIAAQGNSLGLTVGGLSSNRWRIVDDAVAAPAEPAAGEPESIESARERFRLAAGGG